MARAHHDRRTPGDWLRGLFRQPPPGFYSRPAVYLSGDRMEIEHFCTVLFFDENRLCLRLEGAVHGIRQRTAHLHPDRRPADGAGAVFAHRFFR